MKKDDILAILNQNRPELQKLGVRHAALFGSVVRGAQNDQSDIDILVDLDDSAGLGVFEYAGIVQYLENLFPVRVDVANRAALKAHVRPRAEQDAIYAF